MNNVVAIFFLVVLGVLLFFLLKPFTPMVKDFIGRIPQSVYLLMILVVVLLMGYLIFQLAGPKGQFGGEGTAEEVVEGGVTPPPVEVVVRENTIILKNDIIYLNDEVSNIEEVKAYLKACALNKIQVTIMDDYTAATLYHEIIELCRQSGVNYTEIYEAE